MTSLKTYRVEAFVLRLRPLGEADRALTLFSRERGKLHAVAKGARNTHSKFAGRLDFFRHALLTLHSGRSLDVVTGVSSLAGAQRAAAVWRHFVQPEVFALTSYVAEVTDALSEPDLAVPVLFALLCELEGAIAAGVSVGALGPAVDLRLLGAFGLSPELDACARCGTALGERPLAGGRATLSPASGGLVCRRCAIEERDGTGRERIQGSSLHASATELRALRAMRTMTLADVAAHAELAGLRRITRAFVEYHLGRRSKSLSVDDARSRRRAASAAR